MAGPFLITAAADTIRLDDKRQGTAQFTVANSSGQQIRGRARLIAQDPAQQGWFTLAGEAERDFAIAGTQQYSVQVVVPSATAPGAYSFRLDEVGVENPDEELSTGPAVQFTLAGPVAQKKGFPIWIPLAAAGVLLLVVGIAFFFVRGDQNSALAAAGTKTAMAAAITQTQVAADAAASSTAQAFGTGTVVANATQSALAQAAASRTAEAAAHIWISSVTLRYRQSSYDLRLVGPGLIRVRILESEVSPLTVLITGPDGVVVAQASDNPPLTVSHTVSEAEFAVGNSWRVTILDPMAGSQHANGQVQITYPSGSTISPFKDTFGGIDQESEHTNIVVLPAPGVVRATAAWSGPPSGLELDLDSAVTDSLIRLASNAGNSPLSIDYGFDLITLDDNDTFKIHLYDYTDSQTAQVKITINLP